MSRDQLMSLLQRQVNQGGCGPDYSGGAMVGGARGARNLSEYQHFRAMHPGLSRQQLSAMWAAQKTGAGLVGGFPGQRAAYAAVDAPLMQQIFPNKKAFLAAKRAAHKRLQDEYDAQNPNWKATRRPSSAARLPKSSTALLKQIRAAAMARPDCEVFSIKPKDRSEAQLARLAAHLGISAPASRSRRNYAQERRDMLAAREAAADRERLAAISEPGLDEILAELGLA